MDTRPIELEAAVVPADADPGVLGVYQGGALAVAGGAVFGLWMSVQEQRLSGRQRLVALAANGATIAFGLAGTARPAWLSRTLRRRLPAPTLPLAGLAAIAGSAPDRSPMYFPAVMLTALGAGATTPRRGAVIGGLAGTAYVGLVLAQRRPWRDPDRQIWWNVAMLPAFTMAGPVGSLIGDAALAVRALERARARDRRTIQQAGESPRAALQRTARQTEQIAQELDELLLRAARFVCDDAEAQSQLEAAVDAVREDTHHLLLGPVLIAAARGEPLDLLTAVGSITGSYERALRMIPVAVDLQSDVPEGRAIDGRTTAVLLRLLKVALDNCERQLRLSAAGHGGTRAGAVTIRLRERAARLELEVEDDGRGVAPPRTEWSTGLLESHAQVRALGGSLRLEQGETGVRLGAEVPLSPVRIRPLPEAGGAVGAGLDAAVVKAEKLLRISNAIGALGCFMTAERRGAAANCGAGFFAAAGLDELLVQRGRRARWHADASLAFVGLLWPAGGRPASGWVGAELFLRALRRGARETAWATALSTAALGMSAMRVRRSVGAARIAENVLFPAVCAASGLGAREARRRLARAEAETVLLRERSELVESLAYTVRLKHDVIKPVRRSKAWRQGLDETELGSELNRIGEKVDILVRELKESIVVAEPLREFQEHLATRLSPVPVTVSGELPRLVSLQASVGSGDSGRGREQTLERARQSIALTALADKCAAQILRRYPPSLLGRSPLVVVHLAVRPQAPGKVEVAVRPFPPRGHRDTATELASVLAELDGSLDEGFDDGGFRFTVSSLSLATA